jgi:hypothetical protein
MSAIRSSVADKRRRFRQLHEAGCFVIPNPWDLGSARFLQGLGFKALATTSSGFAWSQGRPDGGLSRDTVLAHLRAMVAATDVPINADFESGFAKDVAGVAESVRLAVDTGVAGLSMARRSTGFARPEPQSITPVAIPFWSGAPSAFLSVAPIWKRQLTGSEPTRKPVPIASMLRASRSAIK